MTNKHPKTPNMLIILFIFLIVAVALVYFLNEDDATQPEKIKYSFEDGHGPTFIK